MSQKTVAVKVNTNNLLHNMKKIFTDSTKVISELMQNARRAGATEVEIFHDENARLLIVRDDGCGIEDFQSLLTIAESGWSEEVKDLESPYGMGFASAILCCERLTVASRGKRLSMAGGDLFEGKQATVEPTTATGKTTVVLGGISSQCNIKSVVAQYAAGFPIPVFLNSKEIQRPHALDSNIPFVEFPFGHISINGIHRGSAGNNSTDIVCYLQGIRVYRNRSVYSFSDATATIIHLDSKAFSARMPDRDILIDQDVQLTPVMAQIAVIWKEHLQAAMARMSHEDFLDIYWNAIKEYHLALLNDIPLLPRQIMAAIIDTVTIGEKSLAKGSFDRHIPRNEMENGTITVFMEPDDIGCSETAVAWNYLYARKEGIILTANLPSGHWAHELLVDINPEERNYTVELDNEGAAGWFNGDWVDVKVATCDSYRIIPEGLDPVTIQDVAMYDKERIIVPKNDSGGWAVGQVCSYNDEYDHYNESAYISDKRALNDYVSKLRCTDPTEIVKDLLAEAGQQFAQLKNAQFQLSFNGIGELKVTKLAA